VADLHGVADGAVDAGGGGGVFGAVVVLAGEAGGGVVVAREELEEGAEAVGSESEPLGELPEDGAELVAQRQDSLAEEVGQRLLGVVELLHVGDEAAALDGEDEVVGGGVMPRLEVRPALERVERAVDLDAGEAATGVLHLGALGQAVGVELAAPAVVAPAGYADADGAAGVGPGHDGSGGASSVPALSRKSTPRVSLARPWPVTGFPGTGSRAPPRPPRTEQPVTVQARRPQTRRVLTPHQLPVGSVTRRSNRCCAARTRGWSSGSASRQSSTKRA
jgi:hypothetical protein